jgi:hypothetical protein
VNLGKRVSESISLSALIEISVTGAEGQIFVYSAGTKGVLAVIAPKGGNAGLVHFEARQVDKDVGDLFERRPRRPEGGRYIRVIGSYVGGRLYSVFGEARNCDPRSFDKHP